MSAEGELQPNEVVILQRGFVSPELTKIAASRASLDSREGRGIQDMARCFGEMSGLRQASVGSANGNRTRISALKGPRANRCTIAPRFARRETHLE